MTYVIYVTSYGYLLTLWQDEQCLRESIHPTKREAVRVAYMAGAKLHGLTH